MGWMTEAGLDGLVTISGQQPNSKGWLPRDKDAAKKIIKIKTTAVSERRSVHLPALLSARTAAKSTTRDFIVISLGGRGGVRSVCF